MIKFGRKTCDGIPPADHWWEYNPHKVMLAAYWYKRQIPPRFGTKEWRDNWRIVVAGLSKRFPPLQQKSDND